jgi:hypothetical protein
MANNSINKPSFLKTIKDNVSGAKEAVGNYYAANRGDAQTAKNQQNLTNKKVIKNTKDTVSGVKEIVGNRYAANRGDAQTAINNEKIRSKLMDNPVNKVIGGSEEVVKGYPSVGPKRTERAKDAVRALMEKGNYAGARKYVADKRDQFNSLNYKD